MNKKSAEEISTVIKVTFLINNFHAVFVVIFDMLQANIHVKFSRYQWCVRWSLLLSAITTRVRYEGVVDVCINAFCFEVGWLQTWWLLGRDNDFLFQNKGNLMKFDEVLLRKSDKNSWINSGGSNGKLICLLTDIAF